MEKGLHLCELETIPPPPPPQNLGPDIGLTQPSIQEQKVGQGS